MSVGSIGCMRLSFGNFAELHPTFHFPSNILTYKWGSTNCSTQIALSFCRDDYSSIVKYFLCSFSMVWLCYDMCLGAIREISILWTDFHQRIPPASEPLQPWTSSWVISIGYLLGNAIQSTNQRLGPNGSGKFSRICLQTLQKKFSWFLFSWGNACSSDHTPILTRTYTTSPYATYVAWLKFSWFLFSLLPVGQRKTRKLAPHENFPLYGTLPWLVDHLE